ncbi:MAG: hypothetical protein WA982_00305 [Rubrobacteraceae bacterium]
MTDKQITGLPALIGDLSAEDRTIVERNFDVSATIGRLDPPESMHGWIENSFGSVDAVREQEIIKVTNLVTLEGSIFNGLRASRPSDTGTDLKLEEEISETEGDPFCSPETGTPADTFGRIRGKHSTTASNIAKYDGFHGVIVFDDHNPLHFTPEKVDDYINVGLQWGRKAFEEDPEARYFFLMWNCLWRAGGSILHGHAQATATRNMHYPKVEHLRRSAERYTSDHGTNYFDDLYRAHDSLGLSFTCSDGVRGFASLTPIKDKELILLADDIEDEALHQTVARILKSYVEELGVSTFNVAFYTPPLGPSDEDWSGFPTVVRLVDRGDPASRTSDMGAMELYAASVVAADPFAVAAALDG